VPQISAYPQPRAEIPKANTPSFVDWPVPPSHCGLPILPCYSMVQQARKIYPVFDTSSSICKSHCCSACLFDIFPSPNRTAFTHPAPPVVSGQPNGKAKILRSVFHTRRRSIMGIPLSRVPLVYPAPSLSFLRRLHLMLLLRGLHNSISGHPRSVTTHRLLRFLLHRHEAEHA
jgi:hypothetical protein